MPSGPEGFRSGTVALLGRPNVGKSTLLNRVLQAKIAAVSAKPQTTRNRIMGIFNREDAQVVFLDTPGVHRPRRALNERMVREAVDTLPMVDLVLWMIDAQREADPGRAGQLGDLVAGTRAPVLLVVNKIDTIPKPTLLPLFAGYSEAFQPAEILPISARKGHGVDVLLDAVVARLPEGPPLYPDDILTEAPTRFVVAELIREKVFRLAHDEIPYSVAVEIERFRDGEDEERVEIDARIVVERASHRKIVVGRGGSMIKKIGTLARRDIEELLGRHVFLGLQVSVVPDWSQHPGKVRILGGFRS